VINISSLGGYRAQTGGFGIYCSTKFAVEGLSESLRSELAPIGVKVTVVEPGYFRTDFLDGASLSVSPRIIEDYAETAGKIREAAKHINHNQPGDPVRLAQAMIKLVESPTPPMRLPLGTDAVNVIRAKHAFVEEETAAWETLSRSTDFPN
jgi:NAD(P)-dependent dehydrogenase (short-subunit alcohol dehydrogenase family)